MASHEDTVMAAVAKQCRVLRNIVVTMRDGVRLSTTVYLPLGEGPFPAVLVRTAYNRVAVWSPFFPEHGMALVVQDCRGRYDSEGEYYPFTHEGEDGYDTLEWIGQQTWCNGKVGMFGDSYLAATQFYAAPLGSKYLRALNPRFMAGDPWKRAYYCDGAFSLALTWSWLCFECSARTSEAAMMPLFDVRELLMRLPIVRLDELSGGGPISSYRAYVRHNTYDEHWKALSIRDKHGLFGMPVFLIGGWYDNYAAEAVTTFLGLRDRAPTAALRDSHRLLIGPWTHGINPSAVLGEIDYGPQALAENDATFRWLDCLLHDRDAAAFQRAPIRLFVLGANEWRDEYEWPLARTRWVRYYLRTGGTLSVDPPGDEPPADEPADHYTYDPADPAPTTGGNHSIGPYNPGLYEWVKPGPYDQRAVEARWDVLVYTSDVLAHDTEVTGPVTVVLYAATSAPDTDFVGRLADVYPDGRSINITEGVIRARYREDVWGQPRLLEPHRVYQYTIDLQVTSALFLAGHRLRVDVTSSGFPLWDRNLNTGHDPATDTTMAVAEQTIQHSAAYPSHIQLPVVSGNVLP
jgi:putative CocE/NonD family hydrolase